MNTSSVGCGPNAEQDTFQLPNGTLVHGTRTTLGPAFGYGNTYTRNSANSNYNSFQASVERKASDMTFLLAYTFSKALDDASAFGDLMNFTNYGLSRGLSSFDVTNNFVGSYSWAIPFDRAFSALPKRLTQGWTLNGISRFSSGFPIRIYQSCCDTSLVGSSSTDEPNLVGPISFSDPRSTSQHYYFSTDAFVANENSAGLSVPPTAGSFTVTWNHQHRFRYVQTNSDCRIHSAIEFRGEFFNIFNHTQFYNPAATSAVGPSARLPARAIRASGRSARSSTGSSLGKTGTPACPASS